MPRWSSKSLTELEELYWSEVAPELRKQDIDPSAPTAAEVTRTVRGLDYALREHHDMTVGQFLEEVVGIELSGSNSTKQASNGKFEQMPQDVRTELATYFDSLQGLGNDLAETTVATKKSRVAAFVDAYTTVVDEQLLDNLDNTNRKPDEVSRVRQAIERIDERYESNEAKIRTLDEVVRWYEWMEDTGRAAYNPAAVVERQTGWEREDRDNQALSAKQVRELYQEASDNEERLLVVALCGWGLRTSEVASLHVDQFVLDSDDPRIVFEPGERKNNPNSRSTVALIHGVDDVRARISRLSENDAWNGYLWPSTAASGGHIHPSTVTRRFQRLAQRADVTVEGETPVPKMGRRFWYDAYVDAVGVLLERVEDIAAEQGSTSAEVVVDDYLDEDARRRERRRVMSARLQEAFQA